MFNGNVFKGIVIGLVIVVMMALAGIGVGHLVNNYREYQYTHSYEYIKHEADEYAKDFNHRYEGKLVCFSTNDSES